ncbi:MAG: penicillin-binding protein 1C [Nitrospirae bacterium]|nr:penicillin-binding protein 1C [Nitrospirota bacterium]
MKHAARRAFAVGLALLVAVAAVPKPPLRAGLSFSQAVCDREGHLLRLTLASDERYRLWVPLAEMAPDLVEATVLHEDRFFRWHPGVNPLSLLRAAWRTYVARDRRMGGSTLTMQLARIRYRIQSRTVGGKLAQVIRALQLERHYSKDEILEAYLNLAPYGQNIEGVGTASLVYFGKEAKRLTLQEALTLAVIPQSPAKRRMRAEAGSVHSRPYGQPARSRLIHRWLGEHAEAAKELDHLEHPMAVRGRSSLPFEAPHFVDALLQDDAARTDHLISTLDLRLQKLLERRVQGYVAEQRGIGIQNASALLLDFRTMEVLAAVGSAEYRDEAIQGQVNGYKARRSPGSLLKPFVYALAMDQGHVHPMTMLKDAPSSFRGFNPENFERDFEGPVKVRDALIRSRNVPAVQVGARLRDPDFYTFLRQAGVDLPLGPDHYGLAPILGGAEVTMEDLARLYAMLANEGTLQPLKTRRDQRSESTRRVLSPEATFLVLDILKDVPRPRQGYKPEWTRDSMPLYWKTGTSSGFRDAWSVGIFGQYVLAVWMGNFEGGGNPALVGVELAAPLFIRVIDALRPYAEEQGLVGPARIGRLTKVGVCALSGAIPTPQCPHVIQTWFIPGVSPIRRCEMHRQLETEAPWARDACSEELQVSRHAYEFWTTDLLEIFRQAGIPRRLPPAAKSPCTVDGSPDRGRPPRISSPVADLVYNVRLRETGEQPVPLNAVTDADASEVFWFADERFLDRAPVGSTLFWAPKAGTYVLRVVDDRGRSDSLVVHVALVE